jgi:hypothetical protein
MIQFVVQTKQDACLVERQPILAQYEAELPSLVMPLRSRAAKEAALSLRSTARTIN